jgi:DNA-binding CsgD family transcriptional regulator
VSSIDTVQIRGTAGDPLAGLTARERQVACIAVTGVKTFTIARQLGVSPRTVSAHLSRIYQKLAVPGRFGLVAVVARTHHDPDGTGEPCCPDVRSRRSPAHRTAARPTAAHPTAAAA